MSIWFALMPFGFFFLILFLYQFQAKNCPDCGAKLSGFISPFRKTRRVWIEGGYIDLRGLAANCHCGCETDIQGNKVGKNSIPQTNSVSMVLLMMGSFVVLFGIAIFCFYMLKQTPV